MKGTILDGLRAMLRGKTVSAAKAISVIKSGDIVVLGSGCGEPQTLVEELLHQRERLRDVELITMLPAGKCDYAKPGMEAHFRVRAFVASAGLYEAMRAGRADHIPCHISQIPRLFEDGYIKPNVALIQVCPPDERGYCSLGISVDYIKLAATRAKVVIAEINERMPRTRGDSLIHFSEIDFAVESSRPLLTLTSPVRFSDVEARIGEITADLIPNGATVQLGIGTIPAAILRSLGEKKGLRIHTGIITDEIVDIAGTPALASCSNAYQPIVAGIAMGTELLYKFLHENDLVGMYPCTYTHSLQVISSIRDFVAINSALQIDLTGQINAEVLEGVQISGIGGQGDFIRAAALAPRGKSIIAMPATAAGGNISRIVPQLDRGAVVTTPRSDVQYVVTEYGVADLRGKSLKERARALAEIAHPQFRDELLCAATKSG